MLQEGAQQRSLRTGFYAPAEQARSHTASYSIDVPRAVTESGARMLGHGQRRGNQFKAASVAARNLVIGILVPCRVS